MFRLEPKTLSAKNGGVNMSNKPDAVNPAMALRFAIEDQWRRVTDLERSAKQSKKTNSPVSYL